MRNTNAIARAMETATTTLAHHGGNRSGQSRPGVFGSWMSALGLVAYLCFSPVARATNGQVFVVDSGGGGDFLQIQEAVDAASQRNTILVRPGSYAGFVVNNKSLAIVADGAQAVYIDGLAEVESLAPQRDVQLSGLYFRGGFEVRSCLATVLFTDCTARAAGENTEYCASGSGHGLQIVTDSQDVVFAGCVIDGRDGGSAPYCVSVMDGAHGEAGLSLEASTATLYASQITGGQGGQSWDGGCGLAMCAPACQGAGGHGIWAQSQSLVYLDAAQALGGQKGAHWDCSGKTPAQDGQDVRLEGGSSVLHAEDPTLVLGSASVLREDETWTLTLTGPVGAAAWLVSSPETDWRYLGLDLGVLHLKSSQLSLQALGSIPASGVLSVNLPTPSLPGAQESLRLFLEPF
ncbi:MAG: hypothetical protein QF615_09180, partial [Planctomycetota bacterium]|nr:hypothetical protein [Planctomycetota bacterium]